MSGIQDYLRGQRVLVSGGTGFVGKVLVEKLLRSGPGLDQIYLLAREKRSLSPQERWSRLTQLDLFKKLSTEHPEVLNKVKLVHCDISKEDLGLSDSDRELLIENTTLIYHAAASVQFDNNIIDSLKQNTRSTHSLLELATKMPKLKVSTFGHLQAGVPLTESLLMTLRGQQTLQPEEDPRSKPVLNKILAFVYVSTTYANFNQPETEWKEEVYPPVQDWRVLLKLMSREEEPLSLLQDKLLKGHPNTYTFSKQLAENIAVEYSDRFPLIVFRPSVVSATSEDPFPGWTDSLNGLAAVCTGVALGVVRVFLGEWDDNQDFIPVDNVARGLIVAAYSERESKSGVKVYNSTLANKPAVTVRDLTDWLQTDGFIPSRYLIWPPGFRPVRNIKLFYLLMIFTMVIPYYFIDKAFELSGQKPRLLPAVKKMAVATNKFKSFTCRSISFPNEKYKELSKVVQGKDRDHFDISLNIAENEKWKHITENFKGILKYYLHEDLSEKNLQKNYEWLTKLRRIEKIVTVGFYATISWIIFKYIATNEYFSSTLNYWTNVVDPIY